jgi:hypothetical protein
VRKKKILKKFSTGSFGHSCAPEIGLVGSIPRCMGGNTKQNMEENGVCRSVREAGGGEKGNAVPCIRMARH